MIDRGHDLPISRRARLVNISRGSAYYRPKPVSDGDLKLMRRIDELHLELPFAGARMLRDLLRGEGVTVGRKHMTTRCDACHHVALQQAQHQQEGAWAHDLPVPAAHAACHLGRPGLGNGHQLHPDGPGLRVSGCGDRPVESAQFTSTAFTELLTDQASASRWMARAAGETTCSSSGCGARSSTRRCTCMPTRE